MRGEEQCSRSLVRDSVCDVDTISARDRGIQSNTRRKPYIAITTLPVGLHLTDAVATEDGQCLSAKLLIPLPPRQTSTGGKNRRIGNQIPMTVDHPVPLHWSEKPTIPPQNDTLIRQHSPVGLQRFEISIIGTHKRCIPGRERKNRHTLRDGIHVDAQTQSKRRFRLRLSNKRRPAPTAESESESGGFFGAQTRQ